MFRVPRWASSIVILGIGLDMLAAVRTEQGGLKRHFKPSYIHASVHLITNNYLFEIIHNSDGPIWETKGPLCHRTRFCCFE